MLGLVLVVVAAAAYLALDSSASEPKRTPQILAPPTAPVAVLNAGSEPQAARRLALDLSRQRVHVVGIGDLTADAPTEYEVLYTPGDASQARRLAGLLKTQRPRIAPTDLAVTHAAGADPRLIVVIP